MAQVDPMSTSIWLGIGGPTIFLLNDSLHLLSNVTRLDMRERAVFRTSDVGVNAN